MTAGQTNVPNLREQVMKSSSKIAVAIAAAVLAATASTAIAQVGVLRQAPQVTQGWVVSVHGGNGLGSFRVRTAPARNNFAAAQNLLGVAAAAPTLQRFNVGPGTRFQVAGGGMLMPASAASLRQGQRVMVQAQGRQAAVVRIMGANQLVGLMSRARLHPRHLNRAPHSASYLANVNQTMRRLTATPNGLPASSVPGSATSQPTSQKALRMPPLPPTSVRPHPIHVATAHAVHVASKRK